jgi:hypothetical protein
MSRMAWEPISWERLAAALADRIAAGHPADGPARARVLVDGAPAARPGDLADRLAGELRLRGRPAIVVGTAGFLRPASVRLESGRHDPDAYLHDWFDFGALRREVLRPLEADGRGSVLPDLWDPVTDRATRSPRVPLPPGGVLLLHGPFLLGGRLTGAPTVHLSLSAAALARRTPAPEQWTLPAFAGYARETAPESRAEVTVRADDPRRPAWWRPEADVG